MKKVKKKIFVLIQIKWMITFVLIAAFSAVSAQSVLLVNFGSAQSGNIFGLSGWGSIIKSPSVNYSSAGPAGLQPIAGVGEFDDYQGVQGTTRIFVPGERIVVTWYNTSLTETYRMTSRISFEDPDAPDENGTDGKWFTMRSYDDYRYTYQDIAPGDSCKTVFNITSTGVHACSGNHSLVNINLSIEWFDSNPKQYILCDKIELRSDADIEPPYIPAGLTAFVVSDSKIELNWDIPYDNVGVAEYLVYLGDNVEGYTRSNTYTAALLEPAKEYTFTITALDRCGNESGHSASAAGVTSAYAGGPGLINPAGFEYMGAFVLPEAFAYGGDAMAYNPNGDAGSSDDYPGSLYITDLNIPEQEFCAELNIPEPVISPSHTISDLNEASLLQSSVNIRPANVEAWGSYVDIWRTGLEYIDDENRLYSSWGIYYTVTDDKNAIISCCNADDLSGSIKYGAWYVGAQTELPNDKMLSDYLFSVPQSWADSNISGRALITGRYREGGLSGLGPTLYAVDLVGNGMPLPPETELPFSTLLKYGSVAGSDDYNFPDAMVDYNHSDLWRDADWISSGDNSTVMIIGDKAHGDNWYGYQGEHMRHNWVICDLPYTEFFDTDPNGKGWQAHDYIPMAVFYDPDELAAVANGILESHEPQPYAAKRFDENIFWRNGKLMEIVSAVFDAANKRLFISEFNGLNDGRIIVHVFDYNDTLVTAVELVEFSANIENSRVILSWTTASEINNYGFDIERSANQQGGKWKTIGFVKGNGSSCSNKFYRFIDDAEDVGTVYYRLKQIDNDGTFKYSDIISVNINTPGQLRLEQNYPNPFNPNTTIKYSLPSLKKQTNDNSRTQDNMKQVKLAVYDLLGREVCILLDCEQPPGNYTIEFSTSKEKLANGVYYYRLRYGGNAITKKMIVLK